MANHQATWDTHGRVPLPHYPKAGGNNVVPGYNTDYTDEIIHVVGVQNC